MFRWWDNGRIPARRRTSRGCFRWARRSAKRGRGKDELNEGVLRAGRRLHDLLPPTPEVLPHAGAEVPGRRRGPRYVGSTKPRKSRMSTPSRSSNSRCVEAPRSRRSRSSTQGLAWKSIGTRSGISRLAAARTRSLDAAGRSVSMVPPSGAVAGGREVLSRS
jgi:hypothetical protein